MKVENKAWRYQERVHSRPSFCLLERAVKPEDLHVASGGKSTGEKWQIAGGTRSCGFVVSIVKVCFFLFVCFVFFLQREVTGNVKSY